MMSNDPGNCLYSLRSKLPYVLGSNGAAIGAAGLFWNGDRTNMGTRIKVELILFFNVCLMNFILLQICYKTKASFKWCGFALETFMKSNSANSEMCFREGGDHYTRENINMGNRLV